MKRDALRLRMIVEQLLSAAAISNHQGALHEKVDLGKTTLETILYYMPLAIENQRKIELDCPSEPIMARGSRRGIESVLANLIDNALRAEPEGGTVLVRVHPDCAVEIADHGEGVAPKDRLKIFVKTTMARNKVQLQKGLCETDFDAQYGSEERSSALVKWRWPEGFDIPIATGKLIAS